MIKKLLFILIALLLLPIAMTAQKPTDRERQMWMKEMQQYKNDYISRKLELSEEQKTKFYPFITAWRAKSERFPTRPCAWNAR